MKNANISSGVIGVFDSGVGGLSVWREITRLLPNEDTLYVADQAHVPYGSRSLDEVQAFSEGVARFLLDQGAKIIVVACNAASAAALHYLRNLFADVPFVGMVPAVKPAAENTRTGIVGVIATQVTFQGKLFASLLAEHGNDVKVFTRIGHGLVQAVESATLHTAETRALLQNCIVPLLAAGADHLVLGCTHYSFLLPSIEQLVGPGITVIDPAPAVASQTARILAQRRLANSPEHRGCCVFCTSGETKAFAAAIERLLPPFAGGIGIRMVRWQSDRLRIAD